MIAACCAMLHTFDVRCDWKLVAALIASVGPTSQPSRQPVIAYVFATPFTTIVWSASSGRISRMCRLGVLSYVRCS